MIQPYRAMEWQGTPEAGHLRLLDQTRLPIDCEYVNCHLVEHVYQAIKSLQVRGAPAIGVTAAYGVVLSAQNSPLDFVQIRKDIEYLRSSRPTAVNLFWALDRMTNVLCKLESSSLTNSLEMIEALWNEARTIEVEDIRMCAAIADHGIHLVPHGGGVLTHCNTGALATAGDGTALAVLFAAHQRGKKFEVFVDETRPLLQGSRLTAWELKRHGINCTLICDNMAGHVMKSGKVKMVIVGADRIAANGDTANKIGTYSVAILAKAHNIPFYVAAPSSTFDRSLPTGEGIPIEERDAKEITHAFGKQTAPDNVNVYNPAFDVTPASLITGIITERGVIQPLTEANIGQLRQTT